MQKNLNIFVIVVTYNGIQWHDKCFSSLRESVVPVKIIVVDNTPGDEDVNYIRDHFPEVQIIKTKENLGFGRANNLGIRFAMEQGCDFAFLLNQDAWIEPGTIAYLVEQSVRDERYAILSPIHMTAEGTHLNMTIDDGERNFELLSDLYCQTPKDIYPITFANAAAWLLPRKTLEQIGGFCPLIYHYGEDNDYLNRVLYHKMKVGICPAVKIFHDSKHRLSNSSILFAKAQKEDIDSFLDLNAPRTLQEQKRYLWRKWMVSLFHNRKHDIDYYKFRYQLLRDKMVQLLDAREQHKKLQPNWLQ